MLFIAKTSWKLIFRNVLTHILLFLKIAFHFAYVHRYKMIAHIDYLWVFGKNFSEPLIVQWVHVHKTKSIWFYALKLQNFNFYFCSWFIKGSARLLQVKNLFFATAVVLISASITNVCFRGYHLWQFKWHQVKHYNNNCHSLYKMVPEIVRRILFTQWIIKIEVCCY